MAKRAVGSTDPSANSGRYRKCHATACLCYSTFADGITHMNRTALFTLMMLLATTNSSLSAPPDLKGKTLGDAFTELLPGMGASDIAARTTAQQRWQEICFALGAPGNEALRTEACTLMAAKLDAKTPTAARLWLLQQLQRIGHEESIDALATLMDDKDDELRDDAVRALANNPSPKATDNLLSKLSTSAGKAKVGLLNALGHRGDPKAVTEVANELSGLPETAIPAARALGRIPGEQSVKALLKAREGAKDALRTAIADALLVHADRLFKAGKMKEASELYES
jgi:hypothetical protein